VSGPAVAEPARSEPTTGEAMAEGSFAAMRARRQRSAQLAVAFLLALVAFYLRNLYKNWTSVRIEVVNGSADRVTELEVASGDSAVRVGALAREEERHFRLHPDAEGEVTLNYRIGGQLFHWGGGYVEPTGGYRMRVEIRDGDAVRQETDTDIW
jgi:hypothetical protein